MSSSPRILDISARMPADGLSAGFTHAVHLRFAQLQGMSAFASNARLQQTLEREASPLCTAVFQIGFKVRRAAVMRPASRHRCTAGSVLQLPSIRDVLRAAQRGTWKRFSDEGPIGRKGRSCSC